MIGKLGKHRGIVSLVLLVFMVLSGLPGLAINDSIEFNAGRVSIKSTSVENKLSKNVQDKLKEDKYVEVLVYLREEADIEKISMYNLQKNKFETPSKAILTTRNAVINELKNTAEDSQIRLVDYIEREERRGNVREYESFYIVNMMYVEATEKVIERIAKMPEVEKIDLNKTITRESSEIEESNSREISLQSGNHDHDNVEWNVKQIGANLAWDEGFDGTGIVIGVMDSGVDGGHPAIERKWRSYNEDNPAAPIDPEKSWFDPIYNRTLPYEDPKSLNSPHGTHVTGTILGSEEDGSNRVGVAPGAKWIAAKTFDGENTTERWLLSSGEWMLAPGGDPEAAPNIINNSWGGAEGIDDWYRKIVQAWRAAGILPVFSAGNQREDEPAPWPGSISIPATYPESLAVGAVDSKNQIGWLSKLGPSSYGKDLVKPNLSAPGIDIRSCGIDGEYLGGWDGTSMAAPAVSGAAALVLQANGGLTVDQLQEILETTATPLVDTTYPESPNYGFGHGLVDCHAAVSKALDGVGKIEGKVFVEGEDQELPLIIHEQENTVAYGNSDLEIFAEVSDDVSITKVELMMRNNDGNWRSKPMKRVEGDYTSGLYGALIKEEDQKIGNLEYRIVAEDHKGQIQTTEDHLIDIKFGIVPGEYETDFENYPMGWIFEEQWDWGKVRTNEPKPYSGDKLVGTNLMGAYKSVESTLYTPPIDLRDENLDTAMVSYYEWYETETYFDTCQVYLSDDYGNSWRALGEKFSGEGKEWNEKILDLRDYIGSESPIYLAFSLKPDTVFGSDSLGWYIDNFSLLSEDNLPPIKVEGLMTEARVEGVRLKWEESTEGDFSHYSIYRRQDGEFEKIGETKTNRYLDTDVLAGEKYEYMVTALDLVGNESLESDSIIATIPSVDRIYFSDFESDDGGMTSYGENNDWEWGELNGTYGPEKSELGRKAWATKISGSYSSNSDSKLETPKFTLPRQGNVMANIYSWIEAEEDTYGEDYGRIEVSEDGKNWMDVTPDDAPLKNDHRKWNNIEVDLNDYLGKEISLRLNFVSDRSTNYDGWYVKSIGVYNLVEEEELVVPSINKKDYYNRRNINLQGLVDDKIGENYEGEEEFISELPAKAVVTVLETGRSVYTNPATGGFKLIHPTTFEGEYLTIRSEAYGHYPRDLKISLDEDEEVYLEIPLKPIPKGVVTGRIVDRYSKEPITGARVRIIEDANMDIGISDEDGNFVINGVYEGDYTLKVMGADLENSYLNLSVDSNSENHMDIEVKRYIGFEETIIHDRNQIHEALMMNEPGQGFATRYTPNGVGKVKGVNVFFVAVRQEEALEKEDDIMGFAIYEVNKFGNFERVTDVKYVDVERGKWNYIDLSEFGYETGKDFVISTVQARVANKTPFIGLCNDEKVRDRSYVMNNGKFRPLNNMSDPRMRGALLMRASFDYKVDGPIITNLEDVSYINGNNLEIQGITDIDSQINLYVNDEIKSIESNELKFGDEIELKEEYTRVKVSTVIEGRESEPSKEKMIIRDVIEPDLKIIEPKNNLKINSEVIYVEGSASDKNFDKLFINGEEISISDEGEFKYKFIGNEGENKVVIEARDLAGNVTREEVDVEINLKNPEIIDLQPKSDMEYGLGDEIKVGFKSSPNGRAYFRILPEISLNNSKTIKNKFTMEEVESGVYSGSFTIPEDFLLEKVFIEFEFIDESGNRVDFVSPSKIRINNKFQLPENSVIIGDRAYNIKYLNKNIEAQLSLLEGYKKSEEIYIKISKTIYVNLKGEIVDGTKIKNNLIYYDENGETRLIK